jgi:hypothetical protein
MPPVADARFADPDSVVVRAIVELAPRAGSIDDGRAFVTGELSKAGAVRAWWETPNGYSIPARIIELVDAPDADPIPDADQRRRISLRTVGQLRRLLEQLPDDTPVTLRAPGTTLDGSEDVFAAGMAYARIVDAADHLPHQFRLTLAAEGAM